MISIRRLHTETYREMEYYNCRDQQIFLLSKKTRVSDSLARRLNISVNGMNTY